MSKQLQPWEAAVKSVATKYHHAVAVPDLKYKQEKLHAIAVISANKDLMKCSPESLEMAMLQSASMGLTLNPTAKQCYLIPRWDKNTGTNVAHASPSYMGLMHIAEQSGAVKWIRSEVVYEADDFEYRGPVEKPKHIPTLKAASRTEAMAIGAYAIAKTVDGDYLTEFMDKDTIQNIRNLSKVKNSMMWTTLFSEGYKKAVIRRLTKTLPSMNNPRLMAANDVLDTYESVPMKDVEEVPMPVISEDQLIELADLLNESEVKHERVFAVYGIDKMADLPEDKYEECRERLVLARDIKLQRESKSE